MCSNVLRCWHLLASIRTLVVGLAGFVTLLGSPVGSVWAQDGTKPGAAVPGQPPMAEDARKGAGQDWERLIYLPYRNLKDVFEKHGSTVFMPYSEYLKKWQGGDKAESKSIEAVITEAHYVGTVEKSLLRIKATFKVKVLGKAWVEVPVKFGAAAVGKLTAQKDGDVLLMGTGNGAYKLLFGSTGDHQLELELAAPIQTSPDGRRADFEIPAVAITTFELAIPEADQTVELVPQVVSLPVETKGKETRIKANLGSTTKVAASWHARTSQKPEMDLLTAVTNLQRVTFRDGLVHTDALLSYEVLRGELNEASLVVPVGQRVLGVTSNDAKIRSWKAEPGEKKQTVRIEFLNPVKGHANLEVHTEREFGEDAINVLGRADDGAVLGIHSSDAVRESGQIVIAKSADLDVTFETVRGLSRIDQAEVVAALKQDGTTAFKFYGANALLSVKAKPVEPRLLVEGSTYSFEIHEDEVKLRADIAYDVTRAGVFEVKFQLPNMLNIDRVNVTNGAVLREFHVEGENPRTLRVTFAKRTAAETKLNVELHGHLKFAEANEMVELSMPLPEPLGVERENGNVFVQASDSVEVITDPTSVQGAQPLPLEQQAVQVAAGLRLASAWQFNRRPVAIPVKTVRKPTRLTANSATTITIKEETTEVATELQYIVQYAGLDTFRFSVPESVAGDVQIVSLESAPLPPIKQKVRDKEAVNGWVGWTITLQREVTGTYRFKVTYDLKPKSLGGDDTNAAGDTKKVETDKHRVLQSVVQVARVLGLDGTDAKRREVQLSAIYGEVVIDKSRALAIDAKKLDDGLEAIDVRELTLLPQSGAQAYRYYRQPAAVKVDARKYDIQEVVETVVMRSLVEVVARKDVKASYRCRYWLKSSERQRLRIDVPIGSELLGVFIDGKQVNPENNTERRDDDQKAAWDSYFLNVSRTKPSDEPFSITLQMQTPVGERHKTPFEQSSGGLALRLPQIGGVNVGGVAVQQTQAVVWVPNKFDLVGEPAGFVAESTFVLEDVLFLRRYQPRDYFNFEQWVAVPTTGIIDFPQEGTKFRYSNLGGATELVVTFASRPFHTWLFSGVAVAIALLLIQWSWDRKGALLLIAAFVAACYSISHPGWVLVIIGAARYGLAVMIGIWVLHSLFGAKSKLAVVEVSVETPRSTPWMEGAVPACVPPPGVFDDLRKDFGVK